MQKREREESDHYFFLFFEFHLFDIYVMYKVRANIIILQLLKKICDIFETSRMLSAMKRNLVGGFGSYDVIVSELTIASKILDHY